MNKKKIVEPNPLESVILNNDKRTKRILDQALDRSRLPELYKKYRRPLDVFYENKNLCEEVHPQIGDGFNQYGRKPIMIVAPFYSDIEKKDAEKKLKDFLDGQNDENFLWENICFHYFFPHPMRMTYQEFLDAHELLIRPKGVTQKKFLDDQLNQNICKKLSSDGRKFLEEISKVDYLPENIDYEFIQNVTGYLVEADKAFKRRNFDEYYMLNNYIEDQLLGVEYLKKVIDVVQPYRIVFTDRKTKNLVEGAFGNVERFKKHVEKIKTRLKLKSEQIEDFEDSLKKNSAQKSIELYKQYVKDWYERARDWDLAAYIEKRVEETCEENWSQCETLRTYLSNIDCKIDALDGLKSFLEKDVPARRIPQSSINKPKANREEALFKTLKLDFGIALEKMNLYKKYKSEFENRIRMETEELVLKLKEGNSADENITDADIDKIISGLYFEKFGIPKFELWKQFIDNLKTNESAQEAFLAEFRSVVALRKKQTSTVESPNYSPKEDGNERLKQGLKSENRTHRLSDIDGWIVCLNSRIDDLRNYVKNDGEEGVLLELVEEIQEAQKEIAEIVEKMKELGENREFVEEHENSKRSTRCSQNNKKVARIVREEKMKK